MADGELWAIQVVVVVEWGSRGVFLELGSG